MDTLTDVLSMVGAALGVIAFFWNVLDALGHYLHIDLDAESDNDYITALATVKNKGRLSKRIDYALLLIGPEEENPIATAKRIAEEIGIGANKISFTNDISILLTDTPVYAKDERRALIPLPFFYREQVTIGDETLRYRCTIDKSKLVKPASYSVRFFIFGKYRLHRSTQNLFRIK